MPIEMPKGVPFSVDTWTQSSHNKRHHFLTHAHKDHSFSLSSHFSFPIFCTLLTKSLLLQQFPKLDCLVFMGIEIGQSLTLDDTDGSSFTVTAFDANHCPGAVMFLFEGNFGNILHTGDCRLTTECLRNLPNKYLGTKGKRPICPLDYVFLDTTFGKFQRSMPSKHVAIKQVIDCIWKHPDSPAVYLTCDLLGQEEILSAVCGTFGSKLYVDKAANPESFQSLTLLVPEIVSADPSSRFRLFDGFPKLYERAKAMLLEAQSKSEPEPLIIRPSSMWYACEDEVLRGERRGKVRMDEAIRDRFGVWHVCFSMHSSREELEWALQLLAPKWVVSTTTSCLAIELDYVKKNCLTARLSPNDSLWKLLNISVETPSTEKVKNVVASPKLEEMAQTVEISIPRKRQFDLSPPTKRPSITLFGRARLGIHELPRTEQKKIAKEELLIGNLSFNTNKAKESEVEKSNDERFRNLFNDESYQETNGSEQDKVTQEEPLINNPLLLTNRIQYEKSASEELQVEKGNEELYKDSPKSYNDHFRSLYRSMNVAVPRPLPSLVELLKATKRVKRESVI